MGLDIDKNFFLYSVGTELAHKVAKRYYKNVHYVWCTTEFDSINQPPTSNPLQICKRYLEQISTGDRHAGEIENNMAGILRGAKAKLAAGVIDDRAYNEIRSIVSVAEYEAFFPVIYIIDSRKVEARCAEVVAQERASDDAVEYKIGDLQADEFDLIVLKDILRGVMKIVDKRAGD